MLFVLDMNSGILMMNYTVKRHRGYDVKELAGKSVLMVHPTNIRQKAADIVQKLIMDEQGY
jgi:PAS domain S-box-containing protein